jgi:hypothetical protein
MSTSDVRSEICRYRYVATRNFRDRGSFSARHTVTGFNAGFYSGINAGLGREKPACQY